MVTNYEKSPLNVEIHREDGGNSVVTPFGVKLRDEGVVDVKLRKTVVEQEGAGQQITAIIESARASLPKKDKVALRRAEGKVRSGAVDKLTDLERDVLKRVAKMEISDIADAFAEEDAADFPEAEFEPDTEGFEGE